MVIRFLRDFKASRMIKGKFRLHLPDGRGKQHYAFSSCETEFNCGQRVGVKPLRNDSTLVVIDEPAIGEVVLDDAKPGVDYEVIRAAG